ncbi:hypothetical protein D5086_023617 [Populus alba]|uniref:Uncharacterized protein n=1 Tax=Populus alba TaxID=43335 RepID=A0ACC4BAZ6_POPAL
MNSNQQDAEVTEKKLIDWFDDEYTSTVPWPINTGTQKSAAPSAPKQFWATLISILCRGDSKLKESPPNNTNLSQTWFDPSKSYMGHDEYSCKPQVDFQAIASSFQFSYKGPYTVTATRSFHALSTSQAVYNKLAKATLHWA